MSRRHKILTFGKGVLWEVTVADMRRRATAREYIREAEVLLRAGPPKLSALTASLLERAETEARGRDDNHVGTEHLVLGLYALGDTPARRALESLGISRQVFADQLEWEEGPSPNGAIPLTPRARMIIGLAGVEANGAASGEVQPEHLLLGVIRESKKWQASGQAGPHHLRAAAEAVGVTLADIERHLKRDAH
jgi:ATP-dependent Clp protease ATP-binding subunit ClpA